MAGACVASLPAHANPLAVFGLSPRRAGQAGAGVAAADDASAIYYDPAGLVGAPGGELVAGMVGLSSRLAHGGNLPHPGAAQLAVRVAVGEHVAVGVALHAPPRVARLTAPAPTQPFYPVWGDRLVRMVALPGAAVRIVPALSAGIALDVLPGFTTAIGDTIARTRGRVRAIAGIRVQASPTIRLGAVYRQRFDVRYLVDGQLATGQFAPHQVEAGIAYATDAIVASLDAGWEQWSRDPGPFASSTAPRVPLTDAFGIRAGLESTATDGFVFRGGYGFAASAVPREQTGVTNVLDGARHVIAGGLGYAWPDAAGGKPLRVDAHVQIHVVAGRTLDKAVWDQTGEHDPFTSIADDDPATAGVQTDNPGYPSIKAGGEVFAAGIALTVGL